MFCLQSIPIGRANRSFASKLSKFRFKDEIWRVFSLQWSSKSDIFTSIFKLKKKELWFIKHIPVLKIVFRTNREKFNKKNRLAKKYLKKKNTINRSLEIHKKCRNKQSAIATRFLIELKKKHTHTRTRINQVKMKESARMNIVCLRLFRLLLILFDYFETKWFLK